MSIEPEDMLEEALRGDLPTPDVEARVRRRLLAAGVAVGNGVAAGTAGASVAGSGAAGVAVKAAGLSWGLKLGLVALVGIPTVGLWLDGRASRSTAAPASVVPRAQPAEAKRLPAADPTPAPPSQVPPEAAPLVDAPRLQPRAAKAVAADASTRADARPSSAHPSQADFAASEQLARAPQVSSTLSEETRLLDAAFAALAAGNRAQAASLLQEHERRFPGGLLQKERERAKTRLTEMSRGE
jgi:hypothetical protein